jgi:hypothetical protein
MWKTLCYFGLRWKNCARTVARYCTRRCRIAIDNSAEKQIGFISSGNLNTRENRYDDVFLASITHRTHLVIRFSTGLILSLSDTQSAKHAH